MKIDMKEELKYRQSWGIGKDVAEEVIVTWGSDRLLDIRRAA